MDVLLCQVWAAASVILADDLKLDDFTERHMTAPSAAAQPATPTAAADVQVEFVDTSSKFGHGRFLTDREKQRHAQQAAEADKLRRAHAAAAPSQPATPTAAADEAPPLLTELPFDIRATVPAARHGVGAGMLHRMAVDLAGDSNGAGSKPRSDWRLRCLRESDLATIRAALEHGDGAQRAVLGGESADVVHAAAVMLDTLQGKLSAIMERDRLRVPQLVEAVVRLIRTVKRGQEVPEHTQSARER